MNLTLSSNHKNTEYVNLPNDLDSKYEWGHIQSLTLTDTEFDFDCNKYGLQP